MRGGINWCRSQLWGVPKCPKCWGSPPAPMAPQGRDAFLGQLQNEGTMQEKTSSRKPHKSRLPPCLPMSLLLHISGHCAPPRAAPPGCQRDFGKDKAQREEPFTAARAEPPAFGQAPSYPPCWGLPPALTKDPRQLVGVREVVRLLGLPPPGRPGCPCDSHGAAARPEKCHHEGLLGAGPPAPQQPGRARVDAEPCRDGAGAGCREAQRRGSSAAGRCGFCSPGAWHGGGGASSGTATATPRS